MKRVILVVSGMFVAAAIGTALAAALPGRPTSTEAAPKKQKTLVAFYRERSVKYFDFGRIKLEP